MGTYPLTTMFRMDPGLQNTNNSENIAKYNSMNWIPLNAMSLLDPDNFLIARIPMQMRCQQSIRPKENFIQITNLMGIIETFNQIVAGRGFENEHKTRFEAHFGNTITGGMPKTLRILFGQNLRSDKVLDIR